MHWYVKTSISASEHQPLGPVGTGPCGCAACQHRLFCWKKNSNLKKNTALLQPACPIKHAPTNKSPLRSGPKRLLLWKPLQTAAACAIMRHRAVFWHLISRRTQGSFSQTRPPGSHFIISAVPIRTLTAAAQRLLPSFLFICLFFSRSLTAMLSVWKPPETEAAVNLNQAAPVHRQQQTHKTHTHIKIKIKQYSFCFVFCYLSLSHANTPAHLQRQNVFLHVCY